MSQESLQPRRVRVAPGIYYRPLPGGRRRYEFTYTDSDGRRRWQVVAGGPAVAKAARAALIDKLFRQEPIQSANATLAEYARDWLKRTESRVRPNTYACYRNSVEKHIIPALGRRKLGDVKVDDVADLIARLVAAGYAPETVRSVLTPLSRIFATAVRAGIAETNPVAGLDKGERPKLERAEMRVLDRAEIPALIDATPPDYRLLVELSIYTGLRQSEALGLTWQDLALATPKPTLTVRMQLDRAFRRVAPKTKTARRVIPVPPTLAGHLREHRERALALGQAAPGDFVFRSADGGPMSHRDIVRKGLDQAVEAASLDGAGRPKLTWHCLRHTYASLLIAKRLPITYVSRRLGHATSTVTLDRYGHLWGAAEDDDLAIEALEGLQPQRPADHGTASDGEAALPTATTPHLEA
jgi:integrase